MSSRQLTLRLRYFASREYHSLTNFGFKLSIYKKAIGITDSLFFVMPCFDQALLFSFLEFFDLGEDFRGLGDDFLVHSHSNEASDKTSEDRSCAESHSHR